MGLLGRPTQQLGRSWPHQALASVFRGRPGSLHPGSLRPGSLHPGALRPGSTHSRVGFYDGKSGEHPPTGG